ncbi:hypothetical protein [Kangiella geojedonensis]|uniref:Uncharacterized protein n=1 Tax=Kangiella geojedonensis TaxID=914150 RepID=A0A0F6RCI3_9GAMM|nr:hypothetical protein [Kangiella geojedonensis]AKE52076.1 hypothetical protein TQ33_1116 [Kangiella geojedonensis]
MLHHIIFLSLIGISGVVCYALLSQLMSVVSLKYPDVYREYTKESHFISSSGTFFAEFALGGMYKHEIKPEDFKYAKRVIVAFIITILIIVSKILYSVFF